MAVYDVLFEFKEPFSILIGADSPSDALETFYMQFDRDDIIEKLTAQNFQDSGIDTLKVVDVETGEEFPLDAMED